MDKETKDLLSAVNAGTYPPYDDLTLTQKFVELRQLHDRIKELETEIEPVILQREKTFSAAGVRASYYQPSEKIDWEKFGKDAPSNIIEKHTRTTTSTSWAKVCEEAGIVGSGVFSEARVVFKIE